jgi:hypothetical protein
MGQGEGYAAQEKNTEDKAGKKRPDTVGQPSFWFLIV